MGFLVHSWQYNNLCTEIILRRVVEVNVCDNRAHLKVVLPYLRSSWEDQLDSPFHSVVITHQFLECVTYASAPSSDVSICITISRKTKSPHGKGTTLVMLAKLVPLLLIFSLNQYKLYKTSCFRLLRCAVTENVYYQLSKIKIRSFCNFMNY